jgi:hypothetical protein
MRYEKDGDDIIIYADMKKYGKILDEFASYDSKNNCWITSKRNEKLVIKLANSEKLDLNIKHVSSQKKYVKEIEHDIMNSSSSSNSESDSDNEHKMITSPIVTRGEDPRKVTDRRGKYYKNAKSPSMRGCAPLRGSVHKYTLRTPPPRRRSSHSSYSPSSSEHSSSSGEDFPSPGSPRKRASYVKNSVKDYDLIVDQLGDLQRRILKMEKTGHDTSTKRR